jgi:hypothetical protein
MTDPQASAGSKTLVRYDNRGPVAVITLAPVELGDQNSNVAGSIHPPPLVIVMEYGGSPP